MSDFFEEILKIKEEGKSAALATIIGTKGSTPREVGAKMLILEDGKIWGTIGGGCLEAEVWQEAMKIIKEEKPRTVHFDLTGKKAEEIGMICGGVMDIYIEPIVPTPKVFIFGGGHISLFAGQDLRHGGVSGGGDRRPAAVCEQRAVSGGGGSDCRGVPLRPAQAESQSVQLPCHRDPRACL